MGRPLGGQPKGEKERWEDKEFWRSRNQKRPERGPGWVGLTQKWGSKFAAVLVARL